MLCALHDWCLILSIATGNPALNGGAVLSLLFSGRQDGHIHVQQTRATNDIQYVTARVQVLQVVTHLSFMAIVPSDGLYSSNPHLLRMVAEQNVSDGNDDERLGSVAQPAIDSAQRPEQDLTALCVSEEDGENPQGCEAISHAVQRCVLVVQLKLLHQVVRLMPQLGLQEQNPNQIDLQDKLQNTEMTTALGAGSQHSLQRSAGWVKGQVSQEAMHIWCWSF